MEQYIVTGMSCAACQARVEKAVSKVEGVDSCSVSLLTNSMGVEGSAAPEDIIRAVTEAGYGASLKSADPVQNERSSFAADEAALEDRETPVLKKRLIASIGFLLVLMYFSMGHMMWGWPLPSFFEGNHVAMGLIQMILAAIVMVINQKFFINGFKGLIHGAPNMDTLVAMGSAASFCWSTYVLFAMTGAQLSGDSEAVMAYMHDFYFESAAMILTLITVGKMLEARSKGKTTDALKSLMKLAPQTAVVERGGIETEIPVSQVRVGDVFLVSPGENIPVDGVILEGNSAVNEAALTGESIPVDKKAGDNVSAATTNQSGFIRCRAVRVGEDTTHGERCRGHEGSDRQDRRSGVGRVCPCGDRYRAYYPRHLAGSRQGYRICSCQSHICARHKLSVRSGPCDAGCHNGRKRSRRKERHTLQDRRGA